MSVIYLHSLCTKNEGPFWSDNYTTNNLVDPDLTVCFEYSVLEWMLAAYLLLCLTIHVYRLSKCETKFSLREISRFCLLKTGITFSLAMLCLICAVEVLIRSDVHGPVLLLGWLVSFVCYTVLAYAGMYEFRKQVNSSGVMFWFWSLRLLCTTVQVQTAYRHGTKDELQRVMQTISLGLVALQFMLHCIADNEALSKLYPDVVGHKHGKDEHIPLLESLNIDKQDTKPVINAYCPAIFCSFPYRISYLWFTRYAVRGLKKQWTLMDCWELLQPLKAETQVPLISEAWNNELKRADKELTGRANYGTGYANKMLFQGNLEDSAAEENHKGNSDEQLSSSQKDKKPSFILAFVLSTLPTFLVAAMYRVSFDLLSILQPLILNLLLDVVNGVDPIWWHGVAILVLLFVLQMTRTIVANECYKQNWYWVIKSRTVLVSAIYRKALRMSPSARKEATSGEIVNLMSVDAQRVSEASYYLHTTYSVPLNLILGFYLMYRQLGPPALAGLAAVFLLVPANFYLSKRFNHYQAAQLRHKDARLKLLTEILNGVKILKLYGWEKSYASLINAIRTLEVAVVKLALYCLSFECVSVFVCPFLIPFCSFLTYILSNPNNVLTPTQVFSTLGVVNILNPQIIIISIAVSINMQCWLSLKRIEKFMQAEEIDDSAVTFEPTQSEAVVIEKGAFAWNSSDTSPFLRSINIRVGFNSLVSVVGHVGSGKTSLLHAILGEMHKMHGKVSINGKVAYVPQQAWIFNGTIRENIIFGQPFSTRRYNQVVEACALTADFGMFPAGDQTEIGERGINLSGGQKQRISLARAVYQLKANIFLLDDPLSAVDAHVGRHIFDNVIGPKGLLANKCRIFVTHRLSTLPAADQIIVLKNGEISEVGSFSQLMAQNNSFAEFIRDFLTEEEIRASSDDEGSDDSATNEEQSFKDTLRKQLSVISVSTNRSIGAVSRTRNSMKSGKAGVEKGAVRKTTVGNLISEEEVQVGALKGQVYGFYLRSIGYASFVVTMLAYAGVVSGIVGTNLWLGVWTSDTMGNDSDANRDETIKNLTIYASIGTYQVLAILVESLMISYGLCNGARILHDLLMQRIIRAPTSFFDTTPLGRIINRFSRDIEAVDTQIPLNLPFFMFTLATVVSTLAVISITAPILIVLVIPTIICFWIIYRIYVRTARQLKRLDSVLRSAIYAHFHTTLLGVSSIRSYRVEDSFKAKCDHLIDQDQMTIFVQVQSFRWLYFVLESINCLIVLVTSAFSLAAGNSLANGMASLLITYPLALTSSVNNLLRYASDIETFVVSVERIHEYTTVESEAPLEVAHTDSQLSPHWPESGRVEFRDYSVRYRPGLDLVLKNINLVVQGGEKVGIVGRTGAGKSSLSLALFRIIEPASGTIVIDGCDIRNIGLQKLRTRLTIIPQDPVLFTGALRTNLDPFNAYSDDEVWKALQAAHLKQFVQSLDGQLEHVCSEGGENFSVGQRQLVCLARALLRRTKILLLDEATAAVDMETDELIQETIKANFADCTILTIAHRLNTIIDYDKVLVLDQGKVKEFDPPAVLLANPSTTFYSLARDARLI